MSKIVLFAAEVMCRFSFRYSGFGGWGFRASAVYLKSTVWIVVQSGVPTPAVGSQHCGV